MAAIAACTMAAIWASLAPAATAALTAALTSAGVDGTCANAGAEKVTAAAMVAAENKRRDLENALIIFSLWLYGLMQPLFIRWYREQPEGRSLLTSYMPQSAEKAMAHVVFLSGR
ncbi:hypothetical protein [Pseudorhizobium pelagicum]|uniref:hypothetical protein n=1 Tax=Pseudorhizobium pelagicum TaxID=1509405 RepID=UPI00111122E8|nr:hypothetical protein [Pseudorhizobium pelagicum]